MFTSPSFVDFPYVLCPFDEAKRLSQARAADRTSSEKPMFTLVSLRSLILIRVPAALAGALVIVATLSLLLLGGVLKSSPEIELNQTSWLQQACELEQPSATPDPSELAEAELDPESNPDSEADPEESSENELCLPWTLSAQAHLALGETLGKPGAADLVDQWKRDGLKRPPRC